MKYLIINGSHHKGNTWRIVEAVRESLKREDSQAVFDEIHLAQEKLPFCTGCSNCFRLGHEKCPHSTTVMKIIEAIEKADGVIVSSTTYFMRETSLLRNFFDHLCFMNHRPHFFKSKVLVITTTGGVGGKAAAKSISSFLMAIGFNKSYLLSATSSSWNDYKINDKTHLKINKTAERFYRDVLSGKLHSPSIPLLIPYNLFRGMSLSYVKGTEYETLDGEFWTQKDRINKVYDKSVKVPFYKRPFGHLFYILGKYAGRKITVTYKK